MSFQWNGNDQNYMPLQYTVKRQDTQHHTTHATHTLTFVGEQKFNNQKIFTAYYKTLQHAVCCSCLLQRITMSSIIIHCATLRILQRCLHIVICRWGKVDKKKIVSTYYMSLQHAAKTWQHTAPHCAHTDMLLFVGEQKFNKKKMVITNYKEDDDDDDEPAGDDDDDAGIKNRLAAEVRAHMYIHFWYINIQICMYMHKHKHTKCAARRFMYIYIFDVFICTLTHVYIIYTYMYICICIYTYICLYDIYIYIYIGIYINMNMNIS